MVLFTAKGAKDAEVFILTTETQRHGFLDDGVRGKSGLRGAKTKDEGGRMEREKEVYHPSSFILRVLCALCGCFCELGEHAEGLKPYQVAEYLGIEQTAARMRLCRMLREGLIEKSSRGTYNTPF